VIGSRSRLLSAVAVALLIALVAAGQAGATAQGGAPRTFTVALSATPHDATLLQIRFPHGGHRALSPKVLRVQVVGAFGDDYLALAAPRKTGRRGPEALLVIANRPSALLDPAAVHLRISARASLGKPVLAHLSNLLDSDYAHPPNGLCTLTLGADPLDPAVVTPLAHRGTAVTGFSAARAVAAAYDAACTSSADAQSFKNALAAQPGVSPGSCGSACEPAPAPPVPVPPGCTPCNPAPGFACPLAASASACVARRDATALAAVAAAH
jgi:hypothetical protein